MSVMDRVIASHLQFPAASDGKLNPNNNSSQFPPSSMRNVHGNKIDSIRVMVTLAMSPRCQYFSHTTHLKLQIFTLRWLCDTISSICRDRVPKVRDMTNSQHFSLTKWFSHHLCLFSVSSFYSLLVHYNMNLPAKKNNSKIIKLYCLLRLFNCFANISPVYMNINYSHALSKTESQKLTNFSLRIHKHNVSIIKLAGSKIIYAW